MTEEEKLQLLQRLVGGGATINQLNMGMGFQQINIGSNPTNHDQSEKEHPLSPFIRRSDKVDTILDWLHRAIMGQQQAKDQIAPIKAAMDCKPQAVNSTLPFDVFNSEFQLEVSEGTWNNWIKGHHKAKYADGELDCYISELEEIMKS